jgi:amino-acid N-acetyltransferase
MAKLGEADTAPFVQWFRSAAPYIHAFRGKTFVLAFGGDALADGGFAGLSHDFNLLNSLGVRLVLVHGVRPQVEERLRDLGLDAMYVRDRRVTDAETLEHVKDAVGSVRVDIESLLSVGLPNTPMAGADIRVASGNFVTARPVGVVDGVDLCSPAKCARSPTRPSPTACRPARSSCSRPWAIPPPARCST